MFYTLTITETDAERLRHAVFEVPGKEGAAYLLCGKSVCDDETRLLVRDVVAVEPVDYLLREADRLSIASQSYARVAKQAAAMRAGIVLVHSHPTGVDDFSRQDDAEEPKLMQFFEGRVDGQVHGSLVVPMGAEMTGRVWSATSWTRMARIRIVGTRFRFVDDAARDDKLPEFFDRQVRAFGKDVQRLLARLHIGIVGVGGTGSAVLEQLARLGVGTISIFDGEPFEASNVNRVYGSSVRDEGTPKTAIAMQNVEHIGVGTRLHVYPSPITDEATAKALRGCDIVFGCTDKQAPRGILVRLAVWYLMPVIDVGVKIDAPEAVIRGIDGRVTVLLPGEACLFCRQRISSEIIRLEALSPEERQSLADEDYAPALEDPAPAVVPFTTATASQGVAEFLQRLTGFMGAQRVSSETLLFFHEPSIKTNRPKARPDCPCAQREYWGRGDRRTFLDLVWREPR